MKYLVVAVRWNNEHQKPMKEVVGEFHKYVYAAMFKEAYFKQFSTVAEIIEVESIINQ